MSAALAFKFDINDPTRARAEKPVTEHNTNPGLLARLLDIAQDFPSDEAESDSTPKSRSRKTDRIEKAISSLPALQLKDNEATGQFIELQEWEGIVLDLHDETFSARLTDICNEENPPEVGDFIISDLRNDDMKLLRPGAVFRWIIGYDVSRCGSKQRASQIVFRRLPVWTKHEIDDADREARKLMEGIDWQ